MQNTEYKIDPGTAKLVLMFAAIGVVTTARWATKFLTQNAKNAN